MRKQLASTPLFWRVFWGNAAVLVLLAAALALGPLHASGPLGLAGMLVAVGLALAISLLLMRPAFRPFDELAERMRRHDPLALGERVDVDGGPKVTALADAFNEMLYGGRPSGARGHPERRLSERARGGASRASSTTRSARPCTALMLAVEGLARDRRGAARELAELRETARSGAADLGRIVRDCGPRPWKTSGCPAPCRHCGGVSRPDRHPGGTPAAVRPGAGPRQEPVFYRVGQEALTNVARHADASRVALELSRADRGALLRVPSDGPGLARDATCAGGTGSAACSSARG